MALLLLLAALATTVTACGGNDDNPGAVATTAPFPIATVDSAHDPGRSVAALHRGDKRFGWLSGLTGGPRRGVEATLWARALRARYGKAATSD